MCASCFFFFQAEDGIRDLTVTGVQTCALPIFLLKHLFHRHRPVLENPLVTLTSYGFPSGHTMGVTVLFGLLALFLAKTVSTAGPAFAYFIAAGLVILLIGLTRVYLGAHFLSDVLGAFAASVVWLTFCWTAFETLRRRQKHRPE